jgi:hypothetical protein
MPMRRSLHLVGLHSSILPLACFTARKDSLKRRNTLKWPNKSACKDSQFLIDRRSDAPFLVTTGLDPVVHADVRLP